MCNKRKSPWIKLNVQCACDFRAICLFVDSAKPKFNAFRRERQSERACPEWVSERESGNWGCHELAALAQSETAQANKRKGRKQGEETDLCKLHRKCDSGRLQSGSVPVSVCMRVREPCVALSPSLSLSFHEIAENCAFDTIKLKCVRHYLLAPLPAALWPPPLS